MTTAAVRGVVRGLGTGPADPPTDADLVNAFAARRDEAAFAELLRRHGPVVLGVCRRILSDPHAADDAFQAVFLVLARKAGAIRPPGLVGSWLYGVAVRTAKKAKVAETRRWRREMRHFLASPGREAGGTGHESPEHAELRAAIDDELGQLPARLRAAVVLCDLGGKSRSEAARELGCPEGTLASRLAKARRILADRLTRRGVAVPAAGVSTLLAPALASAVPPALAATTLAAALGTATASPAALHFAEGVVRTMTANKLKLWAAPWLVLAVVAGGAVALSRGNPPARPAVSPQPAAVPVRAPDVTWKETKTLETSGWLAGSVAYSRDGKRLYVGGTGRVRAYDAATFKELWTTKVNGDAQDFAAIDVPHEDALLAATFADGVRLLDPKTGEVGGTVEQKGSKPTAVGWFPATTVERMLHCKLVFDGDRGCHIKDWLQPVFAGGIDLNVTPAGKPRRPVGETPIAVDPKGRWVVTTSPVYQPTGKNELWAYSAGRGVGGEMMLGHKASVTSAAWSADGSTIVTGDADGVVIVWDAATFKEKAKVGFDQRIAAVAVTADGKRFAAGVIRAVQKAGAGRASYFERVYVLDSANPAKSPPALPVANDGEVGEQFEGVAGLAFSPDGKSLAAAFANFKHLAFLGRLIGRARVWTLDEVKPDSNPPAAGLPAPKSWIHGVTYSPDGKRFAAAGASGVTVYDAEESRGLYTVPGEACGFSGDGKTLFAMGAKVTFHEAETGKVTKEFNRPVTNQGWHLVAFSPDGMRYAAHFGFQARVFDTATGFEPVRLEGQHEPGSSAFAQAAKQVTFSPDGKHLVAVGVMVGGPEGRMGMAVWEVATGKQIHRTEGGLEGPTAAAFSADGKRFALGQGKALIVYDLDGFKVVKDFGPHFGHTTSLAFSPDGKTIAAGKRVDVYLNWWAEPKVDYKSEVRLFDIATEKELARLGGFEGRAPKTVLPITGVAFAPDGKSIVAGTGVLALSTVPDKAPAGDLKVWRLDKGGAFRPVAAIIGWKNAGDPVILSHHLGPVDSVAFAPDGKRFVSGGADGKVLIWDAARKPRELGAVVPAGKRTAVAFSPDGVLVAATRDKETGFFDPGRWHVAGMNPPFPGGRAVAFSPDGKWVATSDGFTTGFRALSPGDGTASVSGPDGAKADDHPAAIAWSPDSRHLAYAEAATPGRDGRVGIMGVWPGDKPGYLEGHKGRVHSIAWSPDGKRIASGGEDGHVIVWDGDTRKELARTKISGRNGSSTIHALAFAPDSVTIAAGVQLDAGKGVDRVIMIDAATGKQGDFMQTWARLRSVAFSPDGKTLLGAYGIDRDRLKPLMTPDELKAAGGIAVWELGK